MPIYEYKCTKGHVFELMQHFTDEPVSTCEVCGAPVQKVFHPVSVHFKGSGFYNTDYGTRRRAREGKDGKESGSGGGDSASKTDSGSKTESSSGAKAESGATKPGKAAEKAA